LKACQVNWLYSILSAYFFLRSGIKLPKGSECEKLAILEELEENKSKIQAYVWGDATNPYVLVMHGWAGRATQFRKFIPELVAAGYQCGRF
jgi:hypothetical protein